MSIEDEQIKIFVINLESQKTRKEFIEEQLNKRNLEYEVINAVDGKKLSEDHILQYYSKEFYENKHFSYTLGLVGCTLSHFFIYERIVREKIPYSMIMEDDIILTADFNKSFLEALYPVLQVDVLLMLFYQKYSPFKLNINKKISINSEYALYKQTDLHTLVSTGCYVISYEIAKKMYGDLLPLTTAPDEWSTFKERNYFKDISVVYPFIINPAFFETSISNIEFNNRILNSLLVLIKKHNFLFFNNVVKLRRKYLFNKTRIIQKISE